MCKGVSRKWVGLLMVVLLGVVGVFGTVDTAYATVKATTSALFYTGLSTDTKPSGSTVATGSTLYETDTSRSYIYNGTTWVLAESGYTVAQSALVAKGSTSAVFAKGFVGFTLLVDVATVNTNLITYVEGKALSGGWANLNAAGDSTTITTNGTFGYTFAGYVDSVRYTVSAGSGETTYSAICRWIFGKGE